MENKRYRFTDVEGLDVDSFTATVEEIATEPKPFLKWGVPRVGYSKGTRMFQWDEFYRDTYLDELQTNGVTFVRNKMGDMHLSHASQEDWEDLGYYTQEVSPYARDNYYFPVYPCKKVGTWSELFPHRVSNDTEANYPVYDWTIQNDTYFLRLRNFLNDCLERELFVYVDLFSFWDLQDPWYYKSPYHPHFNLNYSGRNADSTEVDYGGPKTDMRYGSGYGIHDSNGFVGWEATTPDATARYDDFNNMVPVLECQKKHVHRVMGVLEDFENVVLNISAYRHDRSFNDWWAEWIKLMDYTTPLTSWDERNENSVVATEPNYDFSDLSGFPHSNRKAHRLPDMVRSLTETVWGEDFWKQETPMEQDGAPFVISGVPSRGFSYDNQRYGNDHRFAIHMSVHKFWLCQLCGVEQVRYDDGPYGPGEYDQPNIGISTEAATMLPEKYPLYRSVLWRGLGDDIFAFRQNDGSAIAVWFHPNDDFAELIDATYNDVLIPFNEIGEDAPGWWQDQTGHTYRYPLLREKLWDDWVHFHWLSVDHAEWHEPIGVYLESDKLVTPPDDTEHWVLVIKPKP